MKKTLVIIALCLFQAACAGQATVADDSDSLLSFSNLANEIMVDFRDISAHAPGDAGDDERLSTP